MNRIMRTSLSSLILLILSACNLFGPPTAAVFGPSAVQLTVRTPNGVNTFTRAGEVITFEYVVTNTSNQQLAGPVAITDAPRLAVCPNVNTVGDQDAFLDLNETVTCSATYTVTDSDFNNGSLANLATATVGGVISNQTGITLTRSVTLPPSTLLTLSKAASPTTYSQIGQTIIYTYTLTNVGTTPLGPAQFTISDNKMGAAFNCGQPNTTIAAGQTLTCTSNYVITQADLGSASLTNSATASGAQQTTASASATITNTSLALTPVITFTPTFSTTYTPGSTVQHRVAVGEWLYQIARCYGANIREVIDANRQIPNPNAIVKDQFVTVPRIGSAGRIYAPDACVVFHPVQTGDTWASIAQRYNACQPVLQRVNPAGLTGSVKVPKNSATLYCPGSPTTPVTPIPGATFTPTPTSTSQTAQRLTLDPGKNSTTRIGLINPNETIRFVIGATQGQVLTIRLTAPANELTLGVNGPTGIALKLQDGSYTSSTNVTTSGDHVITIVAVIGSSSKSYQLDVTLDTPAVPTFTPTATPTNTPGGT